MNFIPQKDQMDCGPACVAMVARYYGKKYPLEYLRKRAFITKEGVSLLGIKESSESIGLEANALKLNVDDIVGNKKMLPCILHWNQNHFIVLYKITQSLITKRRYFHIADPSHGVIKLSEQKLKDSWSIDEDSGVAMFFNPTDDFYNHKVPKEKPISVKFLFSYLKPYKKQILAMFFLLLVGSSLTLIFPFLTEALIDKGVEAKNMNFIFTILLAQLGVFIGTITIEVFRNWLMLYIGTNLSIDIISNFLKKMLQLPIKFFDTKTLGDFNQRIFDNSRVESFLTSQSLTTFFSIITFSVFFGVLWYYNFKILLIYFSLTIISIIWSFYWFKKRKILDYYRFQQQSDSQESIYEILKGVTEMKLNQFEDFKRNEWEGIQRRLFKLNIRSLKINQLQWSGFEFLNQLKNILVTFLGANYVVTGNMTLGGLLSVSYIIGQMNAPVNQLVDFFRSLQDAKLSLERLNEIQNHPNEESTIMLEDEGIYKKLKNLTITENIFSDNGIKKGIRLQNLYFQYEGPKSPFVLNDINLLIPEGKITAIVGASGSGKTTLMKLLLKFYNPTKGKIFYNYDNIMNLSPKSIRENCGVVMQDGYIFSDTIERNIATGDEKIDYQKLDRAIEIANIREFINSLPLKLKTKIGASGNGISGGQKQRLLIARAVYKNPQYIFFDEATSALDAENEKNIHDNLQEFFKGRTVVIIAHRLSTVKNADNIIVLKKGKIIEEGNHENLVNCKGNYFNLVKNQLELGL